MEITFCVILQPELSCEENEWQNMKRSCCCNNVVGGIRMHNEEERETPLSGEK